LEAGTTILGAFELVPFLEVGKREGLQNFTIHLYTDGLTEAMNPEEEEFVRLSSYIELYLNPFTPNVNIERIRENYPDIDLNLYHIILRDGRVMKRRTEYLFRGLQLLN
jgi:hypothetical protein